MDGAQEQQKLQFIKTMRDATDKLAEAQKELNKVCMINLFAIYTQTRIEVWLDFDADFFV